MNYANVISNPATATAIAAAVGYNEINAGDAIVYKPNTNEWALVSGSKLAARAAQGWTEAVSADTLSSLGLVGETSDDGNAEAAIITLWMQQQA
jgi:hypothetical protein